MEYELTVNRREPNPDYDTASANKYGNFDSPNNRMFLEERSLIVILTEAEYRQVKEAVLAVFE